MEIEYVEVTTHFGGNAADDFYRTFLLHFKNGTKKFISNDQYTELPPGIRIVHKEDESVIKSQTADERYS